jgi:hypothetical protein
MIARDGPPGFWDELCRRLHEAGQSESWLARRLNVPVQTLSSWKQRNQFRRVCVRPLGELLHWADLDEQSAAELGVELLEGRLPDDRLDVHPTEEALRRVNREYQVAEKTFKRYAGHTLRVLGSLGENGFYAFSAPTNTPYEFEQTPEGHAIAMALAKAICKGALCLYIRPDEEAVSYYRDTWSFGQLVYQRHAVDEIAAFRSQLKSWIVRGDVEGQPKISAVEADRILHERLGQCHVSRSPMWMPGVCLSMIGWTHARELKARMTISLPGARFGGMLVYPHYQTLEFRFMRFLRAVVLEACEEFQARKQGRSKGQVELVLPADERRLEDVERFFEKYSQVLRSVYSIEPPKGALS